MDTITIQMRLESYFKINVQSTITEYNESNMVRTWDRHVTIRSRRWPGHSIQCDYFKKSFVSKNESLVRCNYSGDDHHGRPGLCSACPLEKTRRIWVPVRTEDRERPVFVSFRQMRKFWNWQKE